MGNLNGDISYPIARVRSKYSVVENEDEIESDI